MDSNGKYQNFIARLKEKLGSEFCVSNKNGELEETKYHTTKFKRKRW